MLPKQKKLSDEIAKIAREFYERGWAYATAGNYSALLSWKPFRLLISASKINKKEFTPRHVVVVDEKGKKLEGKYSPSDETLLHLAVIQTTKAGAVVHTHSLCGTVLSLRHAPKGKLYLKGFEILKALNRSYSHEERIEIPVLKNSQNYTHLSNLISQTIQKSQKCHGILLAGHGLYTWGKDLEEARSNAETLEFLFDVLEKLR